MFSDSEEFELFKIKHNDIAPAKGKSLLSVPFLRDANFFKSVIYLIEHNKEGSLGFILNKQIDYVISDVLTDIPRNQIPVGYGGPVERDTLHFIHTLGDYLPNSTPISNGLFWGGKIDVLKLLLKDGIADSSNIRFFIGYSGWGPNQLQEEIASDTWLVTDLGHEEIIKNNTEYLWTLAMHKLGKKYSYWTSFPEDPNMN